ncbi:MAG: glycoside hydrolase family 13 protein, partial [Candidatus Nanopelagicales bacterium]
GLRWVHAGTDSIAFLREHPDETLLVVVARGQSETIRNPQADLNATSLEWVFGFTAETSAGHAVIDIPAAGAGIWRLS